MTTTTTTREPHKQHIPALDGLRGVAVIGVLFFHSNAWLRGGYLGVDLFFVLSGFLITSILVSERERNGSISLRAFWIRRARRLMPALLSLIFAIALYAKTLAAPKELSSLRFDALATLGYVANWRSIFAHKSYWEMFTAPSPLEHTWSLAIEEQFYVVWPIVVAGVLAYGSRRTLLALCMFLLACSCVAMAVLYEDGNTMRAYLGTDTRGGAILIGVVLSLMRRDFIKRAWLDVLGVVALIILSIAWTELDGQRALLYRGGFWVTEIAAAALILCCVEKRDGLIARLFSFAPLRWMGVISYGVYLWHWPVYVVVTEERLGVSGFALFGIRIALTILIAYVSYRVMEKPIRENGLRFGFGRVLPARVVVPAAFALAVGLVIATTRVVRATEPTMPPPVSITASSASSPVIASTDAIEPPKPMPYRFFPPASALPPNTLRVLVVGDSVGIALGGRMHWDGPSEGVFAVERAVGDCSILDGIVPVFSMSGPPHDNGNCAESWVSDVTELKPDVTVIVIGGAYFSTVMVDGTRRSVCHQAWHDAYVKRLSELLLAIQPFTSRRVVLEAAYPVGKWKKPAIYDNVDCYNHVLRDAAEAADAEGGDGNNSGVEVIALNPYVCPDKKCMTMSHGAPLRPDGLHFDGPGAEETSHWVLRAILSHERD